MPLPSAARGRGHPLERLRRSSRRRRRAADGIRPRSSWRSTRCRLKRLCGCGCRHHRRRRGNDRAYSLPNYAVGIDARFCHGLVMLAAVLGTIRASRWRMPRRRPADRRVGSHRGPGKIPATSPRWLDLIAALESRQSGGVSWEADRREARSTTCWRGSSPAPWDSTRARVNYIPFSGGGEAPHSAAWRQRHRRHQWVMANLPRTCESGRLARSRCRHRCACPRSDMPTLREQGIPVDIANWRGIMTAAVGLSAEGARSARRTMAEMVRSKTWQQTLKDQRMG